MQQKYSEDLFETTKMTFGEHLEELRGSLLKAVLALVVGFLVGLYFGDRIVRWLQVPLVASLERYYQKQSETQFREIVLDRQAAGKPVPPGDPDELAEFMATESMSFDEVFLDPQTLFSELQRRYPSELDGIALPPKEAGDAQLKREGMISVFLWRPQAYDSRTKLKSLNAQEAFMIFIKASLLAGAVLASPFIFYFVWQFVAAGLYPHERRYVNVFLPVSIVLFLGGAALAFFVVFRFVLDFLFGINAWLGIDPDPRISEWLSFALLMPIGFGISFQLPLVMLFLERIGVFSVKTYLAKWRISVLVIAIISMVLTPADPFSMILMGVPLIVLYFLGIAFCHYMPRATSPFGDDAIE